MYDVAIVGLGPVGSAATLLFAEAGLSVIGIEKSPEIYPLPRAVNLDGEIIRAFQKVHRGDAVQALMQPLRQGERAGFANAERQWLFGQDMAAFGINGWQPVNMFDQPELEAWLRAEMLAHDNIDTRIGIEVSNLSQDQDAVTISMQDEEVTARYVVACDGASSPTRRALGIGWSDLGYDRDWLVVDVVVNERHSLGNETLQVCDPDRLATYVCTKDPFRRWEFCLNPGETREEMLQDEKIHALIEPWTPADTYDIRRKAVYQFHAATADTWRDGRVFLAGDAAHQTPPFLGQGMNAGMRDVINLAWKLPLVISGTCIDDMLDTYFLERNAHAIDLVDWAVNIGRLMEHLAAVEQARRDGRTAPETPENLQSSGYGQGREQPPLREGAIITEQVHDNGLTGYLLPQPMVKDDKGRQGRLDEWLGTGFALVARSRRDVTLSGESVEILQRVGGRVMFLEGLQATRGKFHSLFDEGSAVLVRPDRIVFGHTTESLSADALIEQLANKMALRSSANQH